MGKVVSTQVGDRNMEQWNNPQQLQVATVSEGGGEEQYPTATAVQRETTTGGIVQATAVTTSTTRTPAQIGATVWGDPIEEEGQNPNRNNNNTNPWGNTQGQQPYYEGLQGLFTFIFLGVCIGIPVAATIGLFDADDSSSFSGNPPTAFPTPTPVDVFECPVLFDGNNRNVVMTSCDEDVCGGSIEWCDLNTTRSYRLILSIRGDYDALAESMDISIDGFEATVTASDQCDADFDTVLDRTFTPSTATVVLTYQNSGFVDNICGGLSTEMNATLVQL